MTTKTKIKPVLIWEDKQTIARLTKAANDTLPFAQLVYDAWASIPGLPEFTAQDYKDSINDVIPLVTDLTVKIYNKTWGDAHLALGISEEKGMNLVSDKLPVFTNYIQKLKDFMALPYAQGGSSGSFNRDFAQPEAFTVDKGAMIVDQVYIDQQTAGCRLYLTTQTELKIKNALEILVSNLNSISEIIPISIWKFVIGGNGPANDVNLNQLKDLIKVTVNHGQSTPEFKVDSQFYFKLHNEVIKQQLT